MNDAVRERLGLLKLVTAPSGQTYRVRILDDLREYELLARGFDEAMVCAQLQLEDAVFRHFVGVGRCDLPVEDRVPILEAIFAKVKDAMAAATTASDPYAARVAEYKAKKPVSVSVE